MTHTYQITGMTCVGCEAKIKSALLMIEAVEEVQISLNDSTATITMSEHIPIETLQKNISKHGDTYQIKPMNHSENIEKTKSWFNTYKPILLIFMYILAVTILIEINSENMSWFSWMRNFMAGFFLVFSFFKLLNLEGFKNSYMMYDIVAKRIPNWSYVYAFTELALGVAFLINFSPIVTNSVTLIIMSISIIGVLQSVLNKKSIKCACLGDVFNLPMSTITIIEDGLMILMSLTMLLFQLT